VASLIRCRMSSAFAWLCTGEVGLPIGAGGIPLGGGEAESLSSQLFEVLPLLSQLESRSLPLLAYFGGRPRRLDWGARAEVAAVAQVGGGEALGPATLAVAAAGAGERDPEGCLVADVLADDVGWGEGCSVARARWVTSMSSSSLARDKAGGNCSDRDAERWPVTEYPQRGCTVGNVSIRPGQPKSAETNEPSVR